MGQPEDPDLGRPVDPDEGPEQRLPEGYLDIYKLAVEMADRISARRAVASTFFLTVLSSLIVVIGLTTNDEWAFAVPGLVLAMTWWLLLRSYRLLNRAKFKVIHKMEERLPLQPFTDEWPITELVPDDEIVRFRRMKALRGRYAELGVLEQTVPTVFGVIFLVILVSSWT
jgi:nitrate/nitrite transporter NarK